MCPVILNKTMSRIVIPASDVWPDLQIPPRVQFSQEFTELRERCQPLAKGKYEKRLETGDGGPKTGMKRRETGDRRRETREGAGIGEMDLAYEK